MNQKLSRRLFLKQASLGAAMLGMASLAACSAGGGSQSRSAGTPTVTRRQITIKFITPAALGLERTMYENFILKFQDEHPEIKVEVSFEAWDDYMTKLPTILAGGVIPDVIHQHMSIVQDYGQRGALLDLKPYMDRDGIRPEDYIPALFDAFSNEGKVYAIPKDSAAWGVYYNKQMFDKAGVPYPSLDWTLDDFREMAIALTIDRNGRPASDPKFDPRRIKQWGFSWLVPTPTDSENARGFVRAFGGDWYNKDYTETLITQPPVIDDFTFFHQLRCQHHAAPSPSQALGQGDPFRSGLTAMAVAFHNMDFFCRQENVRFEYDVTYLPKGPGGQYVPVGASGWAIPAQAPHKEEAWELVKYLTSEPVQRYIGQQQRWGVSLKDAVDTIVPEDTPAKNFKRVHVDPLQGRTDRTVISFKFPANQSKIKEIYSGNFDPIWNCDSTDIKGAASRTKEQVDAVLRS